MKVYWIKARAPRRVLAVLRHLRAEADLIEIDVMAGGFQDPAYVARNPNKKAPVLVDGDAVPREAPAIMAYLRIRYNSGMRPAHNPREQVEVPRRPANLSRLRAWADPWPAGAAA